MQNGTICVNVNYAQNDIFDCLDRQTEPMPGRSRQRFSLGKKENVVTGRGHEGDFWGAGHVSMALAVITRVYLLGQKHPYD